MADCPRCQYPRSPGARFCSRCGAELAEPAHGAPGGGEVDGERRHLTVMFCDLVESTALSERLDPEELRDLLAAYHETSASVVERFEGHVAQYLGDGLLVYFAYPQAHEDDAERAVRAGLAILEELAGINPRLAREHGMGVAVRIGIHTGPVVVDEAGGAQQHEAVALGYPVNLAARLQAIARPDSVVISESTLHLVQGLFVTEDLGTHTLKGVSEPIPVHRVLRPSGVRSRLDVAAAAGLSPLVGREQELSFLLENWDHAREGTGRVVLVRGEPGIGKSRLVLALRDRLADESHGWLECRGSPHREKSAFHPVIDLLRQRLELTLETSPEEQTERIERALDRAGLDREETLPLFAGLLSLEPPERYPPLGLSAEAQRRKMLESLARWLSELAAQQPTVLVVEDLHWTDPSSLELLELLIARAPTAPVLLVLTFRPTFVPPWAGRPALEEMTLHPLTRRQTTELVGAITGDRRLPSAVLEEVVKKTDGVPLFIEELTKSVLESGLLADRADGDAPADRLPELAIPSTLQDSLMARLDRLGPAKEVAQLAAVLGREFSYALLAEVSTAAGRSLDRLLVQLVDAELLYQRDRAPSASYTFKHALIQEAAYQSLLRGTRRALHARIVEALEEGFPARVASEPEVLARHCEEGDLLEKAIGYHRRAGTRATERSANTEAIGHLRRAIELLRTLPEGADRDGQELMLQVALAVPLVAAKGWGSQDAERAYERARALCERVGETPQLFHAVRGLVTFYVARAQLETSHELCRRLLRLAETTRDDAMHLVAHQQMAIVLYYQGEPSAALEHYERAFGLYDREEHRALTHVYGEDLGVFIRIWMAWALWLLGHPDRAAQRCEEAIELGQGASHPFSLSYALLWGAVLHTMRRERRLARERAGAAVAVAEEQGFAFVRGGGRLIRAWGRIDPERDERARESAIEEFREALGETAATGSEVCGPQILGSLAEAYLEAGREEEGHAAVDGALATSERTSQPYWDAELHRVKGELLLHRQGASQREPERLFRLALEVSRRQQARSLELRAATSLARLWRHQGRRDAARDLLAPIFGWFTEGLETPDLKEARDLLAKLA